MFKMKAIKGSTNSVSQGLFGKGSIRLDDSAFTLRPLRFNRVEPGVFDWQETNQDTNFFSCPFDSTIMETPLKPLARDRRHGAVLHAQDAL